MLGGRCGEVCWDVMWGSVGEGVGKCVGCGRDVVVWKCVGRGVRRCVVGGVEKFFGVWGKMKKGVEKCGKVCLGGAKMRKSLGMCGRCGKVCWDVGEVMGGVGMWKSVGEGVVKCVGMWKRCEGEEKCSRSVRRCVTGGVEKCFGV